MPVNQPGADRSVSTQKPLLRLGLRRAISFPVLLGVLLMAGAFVTTSWNGSVAGGKVFSEADTWWHMATGSQILITRHFPTSDPYSFTSRGQPWIAYEWLGDVLDAWAYRAGGLRGMAILLIGIACTLVLLLYYLAYLWSRSFFAAAVACALTLPMVGGFFSLRPQMLGYILLIVLLICLELFRQGRERALWALPPLFLIWVNTHGTFVLGLAVLGVTWAGGLVDFHAGGIRAVRWTSRQQRRLLTAIVLCVTVLPLTPYGIETAAYPLHMALHQPLTLAHVTEFLPAAAVGGIQAQLFLILTLLFFAGYAAFRLAEFRIDEIVLLIIAVYETSFHVRFLAFFAVIFTPMLATLLSGWLPRYDVAKDKYALNAALIALVGAGVALRLPSTSDLESMMKQHTPQAAVEFLRQHPSLAPTFNEVEWGGYLVWSGTPVFIDGRSEVYERSGAFLDYLGITNLDPSTASLLGKYGVRSCLIHPDSPLATYLAALPEWKEVYHDPTSAIYAREAKESTAAGPSSKGATEVVP